jgi:hypothetical protein
MSGGMLALIENPDQLARLQADPSLLSTAVDEMIRWTTPVKHFMRTATEDYDLNGTTIKAGEDVLLSYWSANRDEDVFTDPFTFDVGRTPNKHLAFGFGVHYCLGAMLARMELKALFGALLPRLEHVELAGKPELIRSTFVSGLKRLPIRYAQAGAGRSQRAEPHPRRASGAAVGPLRRCARGARRGGRVPAGGAARVGGVAGPAHVRGVERARVPHRLPCHAAGARMVGPAR